ncbi:MAG TPA: hypothetical protein V6D14_06595 [Coleofasciculaceae cyanobacterium]
MSDNQNPASEINGYLEALVGKSDASIVNDKTASTPIITAITTVTNKPRVKPNKKPEKKGLIRQKTCTRL